MSEILINVTPRETRVALVENGILQEAHVERASRRGYVGNIYKGRVKRVMPGMQAAFVDIGLERAAFLHASDIVRAAQPGPEAVAAIDEGSPAPLPAPAPSPSSAVPAIATLLHEGQQLVVQVVKDPIGSKGARCTTQLSIPSRYLVLLPQTKMVGVSARIEDEVERARLKGIVAGIVGDTAVGYIVRTNAEGCDEAALAGDVAYLRRAWEGIDAAMAQSCAGQRIYEDLPLPLRAMRDLMHDSIEKVKVDSREAMTRLQEFVGRFMPALVDRIELYLGQRPIFDLYGVEDEIGRALQKHVPLKSGGYLVIDQTEAMTTVDVNTGSFLGQRNLEETVYRTNLEAAQSAARQLRLRNLGGIIIIDFIDMIDPEHRRQVLRMLEKSLAGDHARTSVHEFSPLGLVEMTRKRTTESLERQLCEPCPTCDGRGSIRTAETVVYEIFREVVRTVRQFEASSLLVVASPKVVARVLEEESAALVELEEFLGKSIRFQADEQCRQEQYDVVLL